MENTIISVIVRKKDNKIILNAFEEITFSYERNIIRITDKPITMLNLKIPKKIWINKKIN
jgi:hypothetical protein